MSVQSQRVLAGAFREITFGLLGLFQLHDVEPELAADAGDMLARIYKARSCGPALRPDGDSIKGFLKQLDRDQSAHPAA